METSSPTKTAELEIIRAPRREIRAFVDQPRKWFDPEKLKDLADSMVENGQITPALAIRLNPPVNGYKYELIDGERRWRGCELRTIPDFLIMIDPAVQNADQQYDKSVVANYFREQPTLIETALSIDRFRKKGLSHEVIRKKMGVKSVAWVYQHHSLLRLHPEVIPLVDPPTPENKRLAFHTALLLISLPHEHQIALAKEISNKELSMVKARHLIDSVSETTGSPGRLKIPRREFNILWSFITRTNERIDTTLGQSTANFQKAIKGGNPTERKKLVDDLGDLIINLEQLKEIIEKIPSL